MSLFNKRPLGVFSILIFYIIVVSLNIYHLYQLILLYPVLGPAAVLWDIFLSVLIVVMAIGVGIGFFNFKAWARRFGILFSGMALIFCLVGVIIYKDWMLLLAIAIHGLIIFYLMQPSVRAYFKEAEHHLPTTPPPGPANL